jgi:hypothetical protein
MLEELCALDQVVAVRDQFPPGLHSENGHAQLAHRHFHQERPVVLQVFGDEPVAVLRDGTPLSKLATLAQFETANTGWRFDPQVRFLFIKFNHTGGTTKINF